MAGLGPTLLVVALAAIAVAPMPSRSTVLTLSPVSARLSYASLAAADTPSLVRHVAAFIGRTFDVPLPPFGGGPPPPEKRAGRSQETRGFDLCTEAEHVEERPHRSRERRAEMSAGKRMRLEQGYGVPERR